MILDVTYKVNKYKMTKLMAFTKLICNICEGILLRSGPFLKEAVYQDLLIHELNKHDIKTTREMVFNYQIKDSEGSDVVICNNQCLRSDIELPEKNGILELKCSSVNAKEDQIWQLRTYLENRADREWGIVVNFINKFGVKTSPKVECVLVVKTNNYHEFNHDNTVVNIRQYNTWSIESASYPLKTEIMLQYNEEEE